MSTLPFTSPEKSRRSLASILAEAIICKACGWEIEFLSGGCDTFNSTELLSIIKGIHKITGKKQWLNLGILTKEQLEAFQPYIEGICGTVECINPELRKKICPSKPLPPIEKMFRQCSKLNLKKAVTIIIGLGETIDDFNRLEKFIKKNKVDRVTFYRLKPQKGTIFEHSKGPKKAYYIEWVKKTREQFPDTEIIVGSWITHLEEIHSLLEAGADTITKFPSIRKFNSKEAKQIEEEAKKANRKFLGTLTKFPKISLTQIDKFNLNKDLKEKVKEKLKQYIRRLKV